MEKLKQHRFALSIYFFLSGLCFSTWASRIPTIKSYFDFDEAQLGNVLLAMPISSLIGLPISTWLVTKFHSRVPLLAAFVVFSISLVTIAFAETYVTLVASICLFAFCMRILNISMNTQALSLQKQFDRQINGSFHGVWSTGGIAGVGFSTLMIANDIAMTTHLIFVASFTFLSAVIAYHFVLKHDKSPLGNKLILGKPDPFIFYLGILIFFAAVCEGGMFDWSGIYFREVIHEELFTLGYLIFMIFMALSRFFSDRIIAHIGMEKTFLMSASFISIGILTAIVFPFFWPALIGFCLVGFGTAAVFPMTFSLAGTSTKYSPGMAISIIATYGTVGMFIGPPLIGYLAHAFSLKISFIIFIFCGLMFIPVSKLLFQNQKKAA
ncbi:MFS transporter [Arenibacter sp. GZD96]|uniref:MFS transporter n=1 Tax=Aurantibrevibacter litoralis TaxID=3106030 RepID=UPI002AFFD6EA|nr:MFS transporter [Arenibacter sp. GZD-96]MEA1785983.1 MFS transporter [Arenibacter sp. GZD-96]